nr:hypothetical protein [uncultured Shinella sp.]
MKNWQETLDSAAPLVEFLSSSSFFGLPYSGSGEALVITNPAVGIQYATDASLTEFDEWETVSDSSGVFPDGFEWSRQISWQLNKNRCWGLEDRNFNGADSKWISGEACILKELMLRDMNILLNCYANDFFPGLWKDILRIYLANGFPCGWSSHRPAGKIVVFSNF